MEPVRAPLESEEYHAALFTVRRAKNCLWWMIVLSLVVQLTAFVSVRFIGVIDDAPQLTGFVQTENEQVATAPDNKAATTAWTWHRILAWALPVTKFVALASGVLLALTMLTVVQLSLVGRTGGTSGFIGGFFWSLLLLVFLVPWQQIIKSTCACGALYNLSDLIDQTGQIIWGAEDVSLVKQIFYYDRFIGYPVFVLLMCFVVQMKFGRGWRQVSPGIVQTNSPEPVDQNDKL